MYDKNVETMSRENMKKLQSERLVKTVARVYKDIPAYRAMFDACGLSPKDITSIDDVTKLPFTDKHDLRDAYPYGLTAVPMGDVVRVHASSGTTGKQTVVTYTREDVDLLSECFARGITAVGISKNDFVQIAFGYGLFTGGLGAHGGVEKLGATAIPVSGGNTKRQIQIMQDFGSTVLMCTPSYALFLAETMQEMGIDPKGLSLTRGYFGAEPWTDKMREKIEYIFNIDAYDVYGLSEIIGPGVASDCICKNGLHICEDHFIPEIINPETGAQLPVGEKGELVFTCITKRAMPLIRYRTHDISSLNYEVCSCGRTLVRMAKPTGRTDDMLSIRGVNVFPSQIESILLSISEVAPHYQLVVSREGVLDMLEVVVELKADSCGDIVALEKKIAHEIKSTLGVTALVGLVKPKTLERSEGKSKRIIDKRNFL